MTDNQPIRVVCIDDDPQLLQLLELILSRQTDPDTGTAIYDVHTASGGREGLDLIQQIQPDLILLDFMMPDIDGSQVLRELKSDDMTKNIPVIILLSVAGPSAPYRREARQAGLVEGRDFIVTKPDHPGDLMSIVEEALQQSK